MFKRHVNDRGNGTYKEPKVVNEQKIEKHQTFSKPSMFSFQKLTVSQIEWSCLFSFFFLTIFMTYL